MALNGATVNSERHTRRFLREDHANIDEVAGVHRYFVHRQKSHGQMIDVGAHRGTSLAPFAASGWKVQAFEPDPKNRAFLMRDLEADWDVEVSEQLVSDRSGDSVEFFSSDVSSGISSSIPFHESHRLLATVQSTTLMRHLAARSIDHVDFLKVDTEGADLFVLRGFPFHRITPEVLLCEFEDAKTTHRSYTTADMIDFLHAVGYSSLIVSEWHPIIQYGQRHDFAGLSVYEGQSPPSESWGNLIATKHPDTLPLLLSSLASTVEGPTDEA